MYLWVLLHLVLLQLVQGGIDARGNPPAINARTAGKMGLRGAKGLNLR